MSVTMSAHAPITIRVAIKRPIYKLLDYACAREYKPLVGSRVKVNLGNYEVTGIVVDVDITSEYDDLKPVLQVLDESPLLDDALMRLLTWASTYYFHPLGEVLFHALPKNLRSGKKPPQLTLWSAIEAKEEKEADETDKRHPPSFCDISAQLKRSPKQKELFEFLVTNGESDGIQLLNHCGDNWRTALNQLIKKDFVYARQVDADFFPKNRDKKSPTKTSLSLTSDQQHCVDSIKTLFNEDLLKPILLHGITGSGKTEVYLRSIEALLSQGKQILVLVPEIGLTPQLLHRFQQHFPQYSIISLHSGLSDGDRTRAWLGSRSGAIDIVIGTRSAVFTPMKQLGAIIIDEEHDASFKQQEGFMYHGRDMAIKRAHDSKVPVLLGSATPSIESLHNADQLQDSPRYHYLRLSSRPGTSKPPEMLLHDIRTLPLEAGISGLLLETIRQHLSQQNQVMLFLNRRGFSPIIMCPDCGWHARCNQCDMGMTYHAGARKVICHHCSLETPIGSHCPDCNSNKLTTLGQGTERIEAVLNTHFPNTPIIRIDRDSTSRKGALEAKLAIVNQGKPAILVGTQMLTKGHDFPKLTLVGILDIDQALFSIDYRAQERLAQQLLQVAGRAGRGVDAGQVILQTSQPQHPLLLNLLSNGYTETAKQLLNERRIWNYPPLGSQALIRVNAEDESNAFVFSDKLSLKIKELLNQHKDIYVEILGPMPSPIAKRANRFRFQLLISAKKRRDLHQFLAIIFPTILQSRKTKGLRWNLDIDPTDFI